MPEYRFYSVKKDGHLAGPPEVVVCLDDEAAVNQAKQLLGQLVIEVWQGARVVARLEPK